ncbi:hypothetical protein C2I27_04155 [Priestia megaterium]|uniref:hypothetical protein n=1 Tax=Priestia megaterium TaxID=1404 RepID=UPI000D524BF7|nr:hypothetical protein [Priestia megaterium]PVC75086.1 hypothetical protein C2I27_04155 [Priestia megaterium]
MPEPNTGGQLRTNITDMQVGDYIPCSYIANLATNRRGYLVELGVSSKQEIPIPANALVDGKFYFIKVDKGLLVSDRVVQTSISWNTLNSAQLVEGASSIGNAFNDTSYPPGIVGKIRSLGGGNSFATVDRKSSTTDTGNGAWPVDNEWDTYIVKKDYGTGAGRDDVWHHVQVLTTWTQETPSLNFGLSTKRIGRGRLDGKNTTTPLSNYVGIDYGFRPVFEYQEVTN